jgi:hypothetical protein
MRAKSDKDNPISDLSSLISTFSIFELYPRMQIRKGQYGKNWFAILPKYTHILPSP